MPTSPTPQTPVPTMPAAAAATNQATGGNAVIPTAPAGTALPTTLTADMLAPKPAIDYQSPAPTPIYNVAGLSGAFTTTASQQKAQDLSGTIQDLNTQDANKAAFTADQYKTLGYGVTTDSQGNIVASDPALNDLNTQLTTLQNNAQAIPIQMQQDAAGRGITAGGLQPHTDAALRENAIQALTVNSLIAARQGKMATAKMIVDQAVTQKFGPIEAQIAAATKNLQLVINSPQYSVEEKQQAQAQLAAQTAQQNQLDQAKTNYTNGQNEVLKYAGVATADQLRQLSGAAADGPAAVTQVAASLGLQQPQAGRYVDQTTTVKNIDGTTSVVRRIFDSVTGQFVNAAPGTTAAALNSSNGGSTAPHFGGVPGTTGTPAVDVTQQGYTSTPIANSGGLTQASIDQKALSYLTSGTLPPVGRTGLAGLQNAAISNRMAEMDAGGNLAAHKAQLASLSSSLTQQTNYLNTTQRAFNTANDTLAALQTFMAQNNINPSQFPDFNSFSNFLKAHGIDPGAAGGYNAQVTTLRAEYSQVLAKGGVRSVETDQEAAKLIPDGLAPADLAKVAQQIKVDGQNVTNDAQKQVQSIQDQINGIIHPPSAPAGTAPSKLPSDIQTKVTQNVTFSADGKTAYLPRAVWSTFGANQDAVLEEAKNDGFTLLIQ